MSTHSAPQPRPIIICADDFGMYAGIDRGILALAQQGRLNAVGCMASGPSLPEHADALARLPLDIGLHLNFTEPFSLQDEECQPLSRLIVRAYLRRLSPQKITAQIHRQLDMFEQHIGRAPDFIDGHQHIHQLPVIREALCDVIKQRYPAAPLWIRSTRPSPTLAWRRDWLKQNIIAGLGSGPMRALALAHGLGINPHLLGVYDFSATRAQYQTRLIQWLNTMQQGDVLMCHPAETAHADDPIGVQRTREFSVLSDPEFPHWLKEAKVTLLKTSLLRREKR